MKLTSVTPAHAVAQADSSGLAAIARQSAAAGAVVAPDEVHVGALTGQVQAAQTQLASMADIDAQRVADIKAALERGEIGFDPAKLAGLIMRHHGGR